LIIYCIIIGIIVVTYSVLFLCNYVLTSSISTLVDRWKTK